MTFRPNYFLLFLLIFIGEVFIALYVHDSFIRPHGGDFLVVIMIYCFLKAFFRMSVLKACVGSLLFAYAVEGLQYVNIVVKLNLEQYPVAKIILGSQFEWFDMVAYTAGIVIVVVIKTLTKSHKFFNFQ